MKPSTPIPDPAAEEQAALWAARLEGSSLTAANHAALEAWLAENPAHRTLLSQYCQFSADLEEQLPALVAAGALTMPAGVTPRLEKIPGSRGWGARRIAGVAVAAAALVMLTFWLARPARQSESFATASAQRQSLTLIDGTQVELNARTSLQVEIDGAARRVRLAAGEAFFTVSKDPDRPFTVETPAGSVRVTGTVFDVHTETASALDVMVIEGSVLVRPGGREDAGVPDSVSLRAGDALSVGPEGVSRPVLSTGELEDALAWRQGQIVFDRAPLSKALERFAHYHGRGLTASAGAAALHVSGRYSLDDLDGFLSQIQKPLEVRVTADPSGNRRVSLLREP